MASSRARTKKHPVQIELVDGTLFTCLCKSTEFRTTEDDVPLHLFCRCGQIYTASDLPPLKES